MTIRNQRVKMKGVNDRIDRNNAEIRVLADAEVNMSRILSGQKATAAAHVQVEEKALHEAEKVLTKAKEAEKEAKLKHRKEQHKFDRDIETLTELVDKLPEIGRSGLVIPEVRGALPLPFIDLPLPFHCLSLTFHCLFTAFQHLPSVAQVQELKVALRKLMINAGKVPSYEMTAEDEALVATPGEKHQQLKSGWVLVMPSDNRDRPYYAHPER